MMDQHAILNPPTVIEPTVRSLSDYWKVVHEIGWIWVWFFISNTTTEHDTTDNTYHVSVRGGAGADAAEPLNFILINFKPIHVLLIHLAIRQTRLLSTIRSNSRHRKRCEQNLVFIKYFTCTSTRMSIKYFTCSARAHTHTWGPSKYPYTFSYNIHCITFTFILYNLRYTLYFHILHSLIKL